MTAYSEEGVCSYTFRTFLCTDSFNDSPGRTAFEGKSYSYLVQIIKILNTLGAIVSSPK